MSNKNTQKSDKRYVRRLLSYAKPHTPMFLLALAVIMVVVAIELYHPQLIGMAVDTFVDRYNSGQAATESDINTVVRLGIIYAVSVVLVMGLNYAQAVILATTGQKIIYTIRRDVFAHMTKMHMAFYSDNPIGRLVTRVTNDCQTVNEMFTSVIVNVLKSFFLLFGIMIIMLVSNFRLALVIFTVLPIVAIATFTFRKLTRKIYSEIRRKVSELNGFVAEHVSGMKVVQLFTAEQHVKQKFETQTEQLRHANLKQLVAFALYSPVSYVMNITSLILLITYGGGLAIDGVVTIGLLVTFQRYIGKLFEPIQQLAEQFNIVQSAAASAERIFWLLDERPHIEDSEQAQSIKRFKGEIEFENVWFAYRGEEWVLRDVSFKMRPGERVAFVGATGAGKTTIQNLICRYYDIQKGSIKIDGVDVRDIKLADLRRGVGQMLQDVFLFTGDVNFNIRLNNDSITQNQLEQAAQTVNASRFIENLPEQYNSEVIERGASLSAGQRQLLSFARTLAFDPSILILDEATANIDTETEMLISDALLKLMEGRTTIIVAHRLSTIQNCDKIIVMHKGKIREQGTHQQLLELGEIYYKLYKLQYEHN